MKKMVAGVVISIMALFVIACSADPEVVEVVKEIIVEKEVTADSGKLVLYSGRKESLVGGIVQQFEKVTGIDVEVK